MVTFLVAAFENQRADFRRPTMEEAGQDPLDDEQEMMEITKLEVTKQNLDYLNSDLEKDLQRLDEANQVLLKKIQEKEETVQSLEREITLSIGQAREKEELNHIISENEALRDLELETAKLEKNKEILSRNVVEVQKKISKRFKNVGLDKEALKQMLAELKVKLQKSTASCANQEKELVKIESDYQSVYQLCEDQAHYIKKYQEILRQMEKEKEVLLLEKEVFKAQNNSSQTVKPESTLVETIQSNMEKTIIKKQRRIFWYRHFKYLVFMVMIFIRLLGDVLFYLQYISPDLLVAALPMVMSRDTLKRLRDILFPFLTLEVEEVLPH
ncbi:transmembrane and coiled-coil domain-containing protein 5B-like [Hippopotamus amphibius kiboko]|uniref:transmembrane and coiled-coil domain-containing protein 5B-like n=1 Tax=Hippopotamus amphibius kiboko TaxID=575201 RepID=UPI002593D360|nr:transmembrane and coiled-coil domain-containing protein 5B-like [Hippopotamus amphibius kiboko]